MMADPRYEELMARQAQATEPVDPSLMMEEAMVGEEMMGEEMTMEEGEEAGRGGDTILAHLTPGEIVIPNEIAQDPNIQAQLQTLFEESGISLEQFTVGNEANSINPETGNPEFWSLSKMLTGKSRSQRKRDAQAKVQRAVDIQNKKALAEQKKLYKKQERELKLMQKKFKAEMAAERQEQNLLMKKRARKANRAAILRQRAMKIGGLADRAAEKILAEGELGAVTPLDDTTGGTGFGRRLSRVKAAPTSGMLTLGGSKGKPKTIKRPK
jgi:hypothetical protein